MRQQGVAHARPLVPACHWVLSKANVQTDTLCRLQWLARTETQQCATYKSEISARDSMPDIPLRAQWRRFSVPTILTLVE